MTRTLDELKSEIEVDYSMLLSQLRRVIIKEILHSEFSLLNTKDKLETSLTDELRKKLDEIR
tara:strand:+ start:1096 stop:1281 length:186 start_codon:yes stop_codon:yes gene_type:complete